MALHHEVDTATATMTAVEGPHPAVTITVASIVVTTAVVPASTMIDVGMVADVTETRASATVASIAMRAADATKAMVVVVVVAAVRAAVAALPVAVNDVATTMIALAVVNAVATPLLPAKSQLVSMVVEAETTLATIVTPAGKQTDEKDAQRWPSLSLNSSKTVECRSPSQ